MPSRFRLSRLARAARREAAPHSRWPARSNRRRPARAASEGHCCEDGVEGVSLARVEPIHVEKEAPAHRARAVSRRATPPRRSHRMPAIWQSRITALTTKFDGRCSAMSVTCRAGWPSFGIERNDRLRPGSTIIAPHRARPARCRIHQSCRGQRICARGRAGRRPGSRRARRGLGILSSNGPLTS